MAGSDEDELGRLVAEETEVMVGHQVTEVAGVQAASGGYKGRQGRGMLQKEPQKTAMWSS